MNLSHLSISELLSERDYHYQNLVAQKEERANIAKKIDKKTLDYINQWKSFDWLHTAKKAGEIVHGEKCLVNEGVGYITADRKVSYHAKFVAESVRELVRRGYASN